MLNSKNKEFVPSKYQSDIFDFIKDPDKKHLTVQAVAGSGKSTTLVESCKFIPQDQNLLFVAFSKRVVEDLKPRLPKNATAATLNSLGHRVWMKHAGYLQIDGKKTYGIIDEIFPKGKLPYDIKNELLASFNKAYSDAKLQRKYENALEGDLRGAVEDLHKLVGLAKGAGLVPNASKAKRNYLSLMDDNSDNWTGLMDSYNLDIDRPEVAAALARRILDIGIDQSDKVIDFDDQLFLPIIFRLKFTQFDWVYVDELQDLNAIQHEIVEQLVKPTGRVVGVGDENQAIYKFRGSLTNSMNIFRERFDTHELPLSVSYRCGKKIIAAAKLIVPHIEWHEDKHDGEVLHLEAYGPKLFGENDAVICRNTRPLVTLAYALIRAGISCRILGKDIEHGLVSLAKKMKAATIEELRDNLSEYEDRECKRFLKKKQEEKAQGLMDRVATLRVFIDEMKEGETRTVQKLYDNINKLFKMAELNSKKMLVLSTGHRAKGAEWDTVFFLDSHLLPSKWAVDTESIKQEGNLKYVIITRAIRKLVHIGSDGFDPANKLTLDKAAHSVVESQLEAV